jgi:Na+/melibiose symporter-like transporter
MSPDTGFRGSLAARRLGASVLALLILVHLSGITYWRFEDLHSQRSLLVIGVTWAVGVIALVLLARACRRGQRAPFR